jgi:hypothetical protein
VWDGLGEEVQYQGFTVPKSAEAGRFAAGFYRWLETTGLEANSLRLMPGGLERVVQDSFVSLGTGSMQDRRHERTEEWMRPVEGEKIVYKILA